jgi:hypothetical protein
MGNLCDVNNTSDEESARPQAQRLPRCVKSPAYWYSALIVRQSQVSSFSHSALVSPASSRNGIKRVCEY